MASRSDPGSGCLRLKALPGGGRRFRRVREHAGRSGWECIAVAGSQCGCGRLADIGRHDAVGAGRQVLERDATECRTGYARLKGVERRFEEPDRSLWILAIIEVTCVEDA